MNFANFTMIHLLKLLTSQTSQLDIFSLSVPQVLYWDICSNSQFHKPYNETFTGTCILSLQLSVSPHRNWPCSFSNLFCSFDLPFSVLMCGLSSCCVEVSIDWSVIVELKQKWVSVDFHFHNHRKCLKIRPTWWLHNKQWLGLSDVDKHLKVYSI